MSRDGLVTGELAPVLSSDLDGGDTSFEVISAREQAAVQEVLVVTLCEQALMAMTHSRWSQAEALAEEARTVFRRAGVQTSYAIPLVCAVQARAALHRGENPDPGDRRAAPAAARPEQPGRRGPGAAGPGAAGPAAGGALPQRLRRIGPDLRRVAAAADARHAPDIPADRRHDVPIAEHH